jgi:hypothetical protein
MIGLTPERVSAMIAANPEPMMPKRAGMKYTQVDRDFVCFLRSQKLTWQQISDQTGFPFGSVHYIATGSTPQRRAMKGKLK